MGNNGYYEGILQLRNCAEEVVDFVRAKIDKEKGVSITKEVTLDKGIDFYLTSNKFLRKIGKLLKEKFTGIIKSSSKLHTEDRQKGKKLYRGTVLFRVPNFLVGDTGLFRGDKVKVLSIGTKVKLQDTGTGEKKMHDFEEVDKHFRA